MPSSETLQLSLVLTIFAGSLMVWSGIFSKLVRKQPVVPYEQRRQAPWTGGDVAAVIGIAMLWIVIAMSVGAAYFGLEAEREPAESPVVLRLSMVANSAGGLAGLGLALWYLIGGRGVTWNDLGFDTSHFTRDLRLGSLTFLAAALPTLSLQAALVTQVKYEHPLVTLMHAEQDGRTFLICAWSAVLIAPLVEEFLLRVVFQGWLEAAERRWRRRYKRSRLFPVGVVPVVISAALFAAMHAGQGPAPIPLFVFALFLGYVYQRTHRVFPSLFIHTILNGTSMLMLWNEMNGAPLAGQ